MSAISRRDMFRTLLGRRREAGDPVVRPAPVALPGNETTPQLALILDRFCLAYQGSFCSVCSERCPEEGAIIVDQGRPRVNPDPCTGCGICHEVCPAPKNAVFLVARKPRPGMVARSAKTVSP